MPWKRVADAWKNLNAKWRVCLIALVALSLIASLLWLFQPSRREIVVRPGEEPTRTVGEGATSNANATGGAAGADKSMNKEQRVQAEMERVISGWCDAEGGTYDAQSSLEGLWIGRYGPTLPYGSRGVPKLVNRIRDNQFFGRCQVREGMFMPGGGIQTVGDLHFFLSPCGGDA